jgi:hypothetical protein
LTYQFLVRLMPAPGEPADVVARARRLAAAPAQRARGHAARAGALDEVSAPLASMARDVAELDALAARFAALEQGFVAARLSPPRATALALLCVGCPGSPPEVVALERFLR